MDQFSQPTHNRSHSTRNEGTRSAQTHSGLTVWLTGLTAAGKSTIAANVHRKLSSAGYTTELLDADIVRQLLSAGLGFTRQDRDTNVERIGFVAALLARHNVICIVAAISPYREAREEVRRMHSAFLEVHLDAPLSVLEQRDIKDLYRRARTGEITHITGIDDPYEVPVNPEIYCRTDLESIEACSAKIIAAIEAAARKGAC